MMAAVGFIPMGQEMNLAEQPWPPVPFFFNGKTGPMKRKTFIRRRLGFWGQVHGSASGEYRSEHFRDSGIIVLQSERSHIVFDAGPFGPGRAGHSHSDALGLVVSYGDRQILVDSGHVHLCRRPRPTQCFSRLFGT